MHGREAGETQVDLLPADLHPDPAVLRDPLLRDVQVRHDLQAADQSVLHVLRDALHRLVEHAVHAEPHPDVLLGRLDVHVGGAIGDGLGHDRGHELDDRCVLHGRLDLGALVAALDVGRGLLDHVVELGVHRGELADRLFDVARRRHHRLDVPVRDRADVVERVDVRRVGHRHQQLVVAHRDRDRAVALRKRLWEQRRRHRVDLEVGEVDELQAHLLGEGAHEVGFLDEALVDQDPAQCLRRLLVLVERLVELFLREEPLLDQDLTELLGLALRHLLPCSGPRLALGLAARVDPSTAEPRPGPTT